MSVILDTMPRSYLPPSKSNSLLTLFIYQPERTQATMPRSEPNVRQIAMSILYVNGLKSEPLCCLDWDSPYPSIKSVFLVRGRSGNIQREITGSAGRLLGMW